MYTQIREQLEQTIKSLRTQVRTIIPAEQVDKLVSELRKVQQSIEER